jgi:putative endonuclease
MYFVYILWSDVLSRYYTGSTSDVQRRIKEHNTGKSRYTKKGIPWKLIYQETCISRKDAYRREMEIKRFKGGIQFAQSIGLSCSLKT